MGAVAGASVSDTGVGATVREEAGSSVSGAVVDSDSVELGDGDMGVVFPSAG